MKKLLVIALAMSAASVQATMWKVTALDPSHLLVQADRQDDEQAKFKIDPNYLSKPKIVKEVNLSGNVAIEDRPAFSAAMEKGPYLVGGKAAKFSFFKTANGLTRFDTIPGHKEPTIRVRPLYHVFLELAAPLKSGQKVDLVLPNVGKQDTVSFTYDPNVPNPFFKVNQVGYSTSAAERYVYFGGWMGPVLGAYPRLKDGTKFELCDAKSGKVVLTGETKFRVADYIRTDNLNIKTPCTGEETVEMNITAAPAGKYFVRIPGIGRSMDFSIDDNDGVAAAFALQMKGLFQQRCGCAKTKDLTHWTDAPCHMKIHRGFGPSEEWEYPECIVDKNGKAIGASHFGFNNWQAREVEAGNKAFEELSLPGGWHDAADYDRRPMHMRIVGDLATLYIMKSDYFKDSQLAVPERGNGIPDVLDEAIWGLKHLLKGQQKDGGVGTWIEATRHPEEMQHALASQDPLPYFLAKATRGSSMDYACYAALLARALEKAGDKESLKWAKKFKESAIRAYEYSTTAEPTKNLPVKTGWEKENEKEGFFNEIPNPPPAELRAKAAINLYALTKDKKYADALTPDLVDGVARRLNQRGWAMSAFILAEVLYTEVPGEVFPKIRDVWKNRAINEATQIKGWIDSAWAYRTPFWPGSKQNEFMQMSWGNFHPLHQCKQLIAAHMATGDKKWLDAAYFAYDCHCGCNSNGQTFTSGLGKNYPSSYLSLVSAADDIEEFVPGISPYRNNYGLPPPVSEEIYDKDYHKIGQYPFMRRYGNKETFTPVTTEFTVWETCHDAAVCCGYLMGKAKMPKNDMREPAKDLRDLPGFWCIP